MSNSVVLRAVRAGDAVVDLAFAGGRIVSMTPTAAPAQSLVLPLLADAHVHLDKTFTAHRISGRARSLYEAVELSSRDREQWDAADVRIRVERALGEAEANGIGALRTHVDWTEPAQPVAWDVIGQLSQDWKGRVHVERAALIPLDLIADADHGPALAAEIAADRGVIGAFVYGDRDLEAKLGRVFELAAQHNVALDFHVDEGLDPALTGIESVIDLARKYGMAGRVLCGHGCSLSIRDEAESRAVLDQAAEAGVGLTVLPTTNILLQDAARGRTPRRLGIAPMHEARTAGLDVLVALDNVADAFYPYGTYDLLDAWRLAVITAHLDPAEWLDSISTCPARWIGLPDPTLRVGAAADFIQIAVPSAEALISYPRAARTVYRAGHALGAAPTERQVA